MMNNTVTTIAAFFIFAIPASFQGQEVSSFIKECFPRSNDKDIVIKKLKGGLSGTAIYKIDAAGKSFVLRANNSDKLTDRDLLELIVQIESSKLKISPPIYAVSGDKKMVLMEHIDHPTLNLEEAKSPENIEKMAKAIKTIHEIQIDASPGESLLSKAKRCYPIVANKTWTPIAEIDEAMKIIEECTEKLSEYTFKKVRNHGDLNPRNIFLTKETPIFIDWSENAMEDYFYDLSYFSLKLDYSIDEEMSLITHYLKRIPTSEEMNRLKLHKKRHQAFWSLTNLYLAHIELKKNPTEKIDPNSPLKSWSSYQKLFSEGSEELSAQYFYDLSRLNFKLASGD